MSESIWQQESCSPGRSYMLGKDPYIKYNDEEAIISNIVEGLREFVHAEPAVRLTIDTHLSNSERAVLAIPFESDQEVILNNFANIIYQSLMGYYISAVPRTSHFGITNLLLEGNQNSLLRREMEKLLLHIQSRGDMAGRLLQHVGLVGKHTVPESGPTFLSETIRKGLDIHVGYRIYAIGENVNCANVFIPLEAGSEIIDQVYYNIERVLHHGFVTYDETGDNYLNITETLVFRDLGDLLRRSKDKELTRNKILNNLQFNTIIKRDKEIEQSKESVFGDRLYDMLNHVQDTKLKEAIDRSRDLYTTNLVGTGGLIQDHLRFPEVKTQIEVKRAEQQSSPGSGGGQGSMPSDQQEALPERKFKRRIPGESTGRRKFQKVNLSNDERSFGKVQVPAPPKDNVRVPSSPTNKRRITRVLAKKD